MIETSEIFTSNTHPYFIITICNKSIIQKELEIGKEQALAEGKPEHIVEKIAQGKLNKFFKENTLLNQAFVKDSSLTISKYLNSVSNGLTVDEFRRISIG